MSSLKGKIDSLQKGFEKALQEAKNIHDLGKVRITFLGRKGSISLLLSEMRNIPIEEKKICGPLLNQFKDNALEKIKQKEKELRVKMIEAASNQKQNFDVSAYKANIPKGHLHVLSQFTEEVENIFISMGYEVLDGPELESDYYNFEGLNIPKDHPARDMFDTFWIDRPGLLMRTHTSPVQVRTMETKNLPIAAIVPGRSFRHEATDASHDFMFMQCECFLIDKKVTLSNLFATAKTFLQALFQKKDIDIRIRPGFFPFVEPGVEIDARCPFCKNGCSVCKQSTWIEVLPGGLIHPNVLKAGGVDPEKYSGFAFGFGLTRFALIRYKINDIRLFHSGKIRFLEQF